MKEQSSYRKKIILFALKKLDCGNPSMEYCAIKRNELINLGAPLGNEAERGYILHYFIYMSTHEITIRDGEQTSG